MGANPCVCIHYCMYTCIHTCKFCPLLPLHLAIQICACADSHVCVHVYMRIPMCVCMCMCACVCVHVYVCMCMCACVHAYNHSALRFHMPSKPMSDIYICVCVCVCVYICMHTYAMMHTCYCSTSSFKTVPAQTHKTHKTHTHIHPSPRTHKCRHLYKQTFHHAHRLPLHHALQSQVSSGIILQILHKYPKAASIPIDGSYPLYMAMGNPVGTESRNHNHSQPTACYPLHVLEALIRAYYPATNVQFETGSPEQKEFRCLTGVIVFLYFCVCASMYVCMYVCMQ